MTNTLTMMRLLLLMAALFGSTASVAATITASVDRNPVALSESFQILFSASETPDDDPDFSPLEKDFDILNQQQSNQTSWVNGRISRRIQWTLTVMAKRAGQLSIPPIHFGQDVSNALTVEVKQDTQQAELDNQDLFLQVTVNTDRPYVQSQVLYTVKLYRRIHITNASLEAPEPDNAVVEKLGEDKSYSTLVRGVQYAVTERRYAIFPQQSGELTIPPITLVAEAVRRRQSRFGFFGSQLTVPRRVRSQAIILHVRPKPAAYMAAHWLPAEQVALQEQWSDDGLSVKVGEPLTRTLSLLAKGTTSSQLPELFKSVDIPGLKSYPDQPVLKEQKNADGVIAMREEKIALIPSKPGQYTLPAIKVDWFNVKTGERETVELSAVTIVAVAANNPAPIPQPPVTPLAKPEPPAATPVSASTQKPVFWIATSVFFAIAWLITLAYFLWPRRTEKTETDMPEKNERRENAAKALKKACQNNDPQAAKRALLTWGREQYGALSLGEIAGHCEARLRDEINALNQHLYAPEQSPWHGKALAQAFAEHNARQKVEHKQDDDVLEPLYR